MSNTPRSQRYHIAIFGRRNAGKSSLVNAIAGQDVSIVSDYAGTTTDTVWKNIELPGVGAAVIGDTAGYDDTGELGMLRIERTEAAARRIDLAIMLLADCCDDAAAELRWKQKFEKSGIPVIFLLGKCDSCDDTLAASWSRILGAEVLPVSSREGRGIEALLERVAQIYKLDDNVEDITHSLVKAGDTVVLVMPHDCGMIATARAMGVSFGD